MSRSRREEPGLRTAATPRGMETVPMPGRRRSLQAGRAGDQGQRHECDQRADHEPDHETFPDRVHVGSGRPARARSPGPEDGRSSAGAPGIADDMGGPVVHQPPPTLEQVRAGVRGLDLVLYDVSERRLDDSQSLPCLGSRQPGRIRASTAWAAAAKDGMLLRRRFSARGSPPARASLRLARAAARASLSGTSGKPPNPSSQRRPRITSCCTQLRVPVGCTSR